jgi:nicotinate-nucleotide pyrophosphorylase (carboxylating)
MIVEPLEAAVYRELVRRALAEDLGWGDVTTAAAVGADQRATGRLVARRDLVALEAFRQLDPSVAVTSARPDGDRCPAGSMLAELHGLAAPMLTAERTALNLLCLLSGVATLTRQMVDASAGLVQVADTRKTLPLLRALQKYAVRAGGGQNGRFSLDDGVILKRSHVRLAGGLAAAVTRVRTSQPDAPVQVEVATAEEAADAAAAGAAVVLYSADSISELRQVVDRCAGRARVEVSGPFSAADLRAIAEAGADFVSLGSLTNAAPAADITLELTAD